MPPQATFEDGDLSDPNSDDVSSYEWQRRIPGAAITGPYLDQMLRSSTRGASIMARSLLKTGNLIIYYAADMAQRMKLMTAWVEAHKKETAFILAGIIILVLCLAMPAVLGVIGFGALGPVVGSMAAAWQATIGNVVAGSLFAFLQSAAMGGAAMGFFVGLGVLGAVVAMSGAASTIDVVKEKSQAIIETSSRGMIAGFQQVKAGAGIIWHHSWVFFSKKGKFHNE